MGQVIFITGTDTGIGKTVVSTLLAYSLTRSGVDLFPVKPVESGCDTVDGELEPTDGRALWEATGRRFELEDIVFERFAEPVTPALAARFSGREVSIAGLAERIVSLASSHQLVLVEGAGGLLSPLTERETLADVVELCASKCGKSVPVKVVVVIGSRLGALNHAGLTFEVLKSRGLEVAGYVLNNISPQVEGVGDIALATNRETMRWVAKKYGVAELGELPYQRPLGEPAAQQGAGGERLWEQMIELAASQQFISNFLTATL